MTVEPCCQGDFLSHGKQRERQEGARIWASQEEPMTQLPCSRPHHLPTVPQAGDFQYIDLGGHSRSINYRCFSFGFFSPMKTLPYLLLSRFCVGFRVVSRFLDLGYIYQMVEAHPFGTCKYLPSQFII